MRLLIFLLYFVLVVNGRMDPEEDFLFSLDFSEPISTVSTEGETKQTVTTTESTDEEPAEITTAKPSEGIVSVNETRKLVSCKLDLTNTTAEERLTRTVELINASRLAEILTADSEIGNRESEAQCSVILFYSKQCPFSYMAAPHFNALARAFPDIKMAALDSVKHSRVNTQYGIVGVPSIILFHNAKAVAKFNNSEYSIQAFIKFIKTYTGIQEESDTLRIKDFEGPVPREIDEEIDYILILAWAFIIICLFYYISGTQMWKTMIETVKNSWREAEAQHEHTD